MKTTSRRSTLKTLSTSAFGSLLVQPNAFASEPAVAALKPVYTPPNGVQKAPDGFDIGEKISKGLTTTVKLRGTQSAGQLSIIEAVVAPKTMGPPPHLHKELDEIMYVVEGTAHVLLGDEVQVIEAGGFHLRPRGLVHTFWNASNKPLRFIDLYPNQDFELYLEGLGRANFKVSNKQIDEKTMRGIMAELDKKYGVEYFFDRMGAIIQKYGLK